MKKSTVSSIATGTITVAVLLIVTAIFLALGETQGATSHEHHLFTALDSTSLGKDADNLRLFCVATLRNRTEEGQNFCSDFEHVHVYVDEKAQDGTYADIQYHIAQAQYANGAVGFPRPFGDFITIHVQTEKERKQFLNDISDWRDYLYAPRKAGLSTPLTDRPTE